MAETAVPAYPVAFDVEPQTADRNRWTVGFRIILAIPQAILVGGPGVGLGWGLELGGGGLRWFGISGGGVLGLAAFVGAVISWFAIVFTGRQPRGLWHFTHYFLRWRANVVTYTALLRDEYPPFGEGDYPVTFTVADQPAPRDRWSVGLRLIYAIPHLILLFFLNIGWFITAVIGWFAILFTKGYPEGLYRFAVGVVRWNLRVQAYLLLMRDEYPPFSLK